MKINCKRNLKFVMLLLSSLLIASVSASVYYSLIMTSTISVATNNVYFVLGADNATAGVVLNSDNTTATLSSLKAYPNTTTTYSDPLRVRNNASSGSTNIRMRPISIVGGATNLIFVNFTLIESGTLKTSLNYTSNGSVWTSPSTTGWVSISANTEWNVTIETKAIAGATSDSASVSISIDVQ